MLFWLLALTGACPSRLFALKVQVAFDPDALRGKMKVDLDAPDHSWRHELAISIR
jgi:hypothetical protein